MSQYPGGQEPPQPPQDPYYGPPPSDPYYGPPPPADPYAAPQDPYYGQQPPDAGQGQPKQPNYGQPPYPPLAPPPGEPRKGRGSSGAANFGVLLVIIGAWVLFGDQLDIDFDLGEVWPIGAVVIGVLMVVASVLPGRGRDRT
jgi:hypothetical protein